MKGINKHENPVILGLRMRNGVHEVFLKSEGGSSRQWAKRYRSMVEHHKFLKLNATNKQKRDELRGYEICMEKFYTATGLNSVK